MNVNTGETRRHVTVLENSTFRYSDKVSEAKGRGREREQEGQRKLKWLGSIEWDLQLLMMTEKVENDRLFHEHKE